MGFLTTGKRHLLVKDIPAAVSEFAQACELLSAAFGETGKGCAESYYYYGKALLEMSRLESGVLGNALDGVPEEDDEANNSKVEDPSKMTEEEKKEVEEKVGEALKENLVELEKRDDETETEKDGKVETNEGEKVKNGAEKADENQEDERPTNAADGRCSLARGIRCENKRGRAFESQLSASRTAFVLFCRRTRHPRGGSGHLPILPLQQPSSS